MLIPTCEKIKDHHRNHNWDHNPIDLVPLHKLLMAASRNIIRSIC